MSNVSKNKNDQNSSDLREAESRYMRLRHRPKNFVIETLEWYRHDLLTLFPEYAEEPMFKLRLEVIDDSIQFVRRMGLRKRQAAKKSRRVAPEV